MNSGATLFLLGGALVLQVTTENAVRLADGETSPFQGRVEVFHQGEWGRVCGSLWDLNDAQVVCRHLGYGVALEAPGRGAFGRGAGKVWLNWVECEGSEDSISDCPHTGWGQSPCDHSWDANVICSAPVRLVEGTLPREGLLQVYYNSTWGWVCDQEWDRQDDHVVCRSLGYTGSAPAPKGVDIEGQRNGTVWLNNVRCLGHEPSLFSCTHGGWRNHTCPISNQVSVKCTGAEVRLAGHGQSPFMGRVEVLYGGVWGAVCGDKWNRQAADVVCRQLGYGGALAAPGNSVFGKGSDVTWLSNVRCARNESSLSACEHKGWGSADCWTSDVASAICSKPVRLVGGPSTRQGLLQVNYDGAWGSVCDKMWDKRDADVVCRMLGYTASTVGDWSGIEAERGNDVTWLNNVRCAGNESSLLFCAHGGWKNHSCRNEQRVGITCLGPEVRLAGASVDFLGRVEVLHRGIWGTVCSPAWNIREATVVCRHLGYAGAVAALHSSPFGQGTGVVWLDDVQCEGNESSLSKCKHKEWAETGCSHVEDVAVVCNPSGTSQEPPEIFRNISTSTVVCARNDACALFCYMSSNTTVHYTWTKDGQPLMGDVVVVIDNVVVVTPRGEEDYGIYVCTAANSAGKTEYNITVTETSESSMTVHDKEKKNKDQSSNLLPTLVIVSCVAAIFVAVTSGWFLWKLKRKRVNDGSGDPELEQELCVTNSEYDTTPRRRERETLMTNRSQLSQCFDI